MCENKRIILDSYVRPGDRVIVTYEANEDISYKKLPPNGTVAIAIAPSLYHHYVGLNDLWMPRYKQPGVYMKLGGMIYIYQINGVWERSHLCAHHLVFEDPNVDKNSRRDDAYWKQADDGVYLGPLPEIEFEIGDVVSWDYKHMEHHTSGSGRISHIEWEYIGKKCDDGITPYPIYRVDRFEGGTACGLRTTELKLIRRGNYYWFKNDREKIKFDSLMEEAGFYKSLGESEEVKNPISGDYGWSLDEALAAVIDGFADCLSVSPDMFNNDHRPNPFVFRYPQMRDLGERLREETMNGFAEDIERLKKEGRL